MFGGISHQGFEQEFVNFYQQGLTKADIGKAVSIVGNKTVGLGADGAEVVGRLERIEKDGIALVQVSGHIDLPFAVAPALSGRVVAAGGGNVKTAPAGSGKGSVWSVDASAKTAGVFF